MSDKLNEENSFEENAQWAVVELMGHARTAGRISRPSSWGGLLRVDVPTSDDEYRTEFYGIPAIYAVKLVSEEIARAYVIVDHDEVAYDAPIVTRQQHRKVVDTLETRNWDLQDKVVELERRLTAVKSLPSPDDPESKDIPSND